MFKSADGKITTGDNFDSDATETNSQPLANGCSMGVLSLFETDPIILQASSQTNRQQTMPTRAKTETQVGERLKLECTTLKEQQEVAAATASNSGICSTGSAREVLVANGGIGKLPASTILTIFVKGFPKITNKQSSPLTNSNKYQNADNQQQASGSSSSFSDAVAQPYATLEWFINDDQVSLVFFCLFVVRVSS